jgi:hypothetical protein
VLADLKKKMDNETEEAKAPAEKEPVAKKAPAKKKKEEAPKAEEKAEETLAQTPPPPANEPKHTEAEAEKVQDEENSDENA